MIQVLLLLWTECKMRWKSKNRQAGFTKSTIALSDRDQVVVVESVSVVKMPRKNMHSILSTTEFPLQLDEKSSLHVLHELTESTKLSFVSFDYMECDSLCANIKIIPGLS